MTNVTNSKTLCCSVTCEKRFECGRADINNIGTYCVEDYSRFGTGTFTDNGCEIEHWCGEEGNYKMFEPIEKKMDITLTKEDIEPDSYWVSIRRFKNLVNKLPDDGKIMIEVEKDYGDRTRLSLDKVDGFKLQGKVLIIACTTIV